MKRKGEKASILDGIAVLAAVFVILGRAVRVQGLEKVLIYAVHADRLFFDVLTVCLLIRRFIRKKAAYPLSREFMLFVGMMAFWILWGAAGIFISPYSRIWEGGMECFFLLRGAMILYCLYEVLDNRRRTRLFFSALRASCAALILLAVWEAFTGIHTFASRYPDMPAVMVDGRRWLSGLYQDDLFLATGFCYNENNLSSILAVLLPLFFLTKDVGRGRGVAYGIALTMGVFVLMLNDANINGLALAVGLAAYILLVRGNWPKKAGMLGGFILLYAGAADRIGRLFKKLKSLLFRGAAAEELLARAGLENPFPRVSKIGTGAAFSENITGGVENALESGEGALMLRLKIYRDAWDAFVASRGLGLGPKGYYFYYLTDRGQRTRYTNPHNWWLEILTQYGIVVFLAYLASLFTLYIKMIRVCLRRRDEMYAVVVAMCTSFVIACVAPSTYIGEVYQWILPGLCLALLRQDKALPKPLE
ncbi:MAG: O-antigen ligase family protein [Oscillospiraceae bacterium]|nr:O-antigen ligase family protein [Oscillospiraceae bacterium]